jgi:serine protease Do
MNKKTVIAAVGLICIGIIFGAILVSGLKTVDVGFAGDRPQVKLETQNASTKNSLDLKSSSNAFVAISKKLTPTVVGITVTVSSKGKKGGRDFGDFFHFFGPDFKFNFPQPSPEQGSGSGVIITPDGYILTNNHVVENADKDGIKVALSDTRRFDAKLMGTDPTTDLAVLKVEAKDLPAAGLGNSDELQVGEWVLAIGNPFGYLKSTVTAGIVSYVGRDIGIKRDQYGIEDFIQTDAAINPGNSGGALVNMSGDVIGINTAIATRTGTYEGYGFAIPINLARIVAEDLINTGRVRRGYLGVMIQAVDATFAKANGLDKAQGVLVGTVQEGSAASAAGIEDGDIILSVDGKEVNQPNELQSLIARRHPGDVVALVIYRDGTKIEKNVTLKERNVKGETVASNDEDSDESSTDETSTGTVKLENLGLTVKNLTADVKEKAKVDNGVQVADVRTFSEAYNRGLQPNDVIIEADRRKVSSVSDLKRIIESHKPGDAIMLRVKDKSGTSRFVAIQIPKEQG